MTDVDDGSDKPVGYQTSDGELEVRVDTDGRKVYHETELGQHQRWMRSAPDLFEQHQVALAEIARLKAEAIPPPASPAPGAPTTRYRIGSDNSGHRYFYPVDKEAEFSAWQELDDDDEHSWTEPKFATRIDGRFTFTDPRCE